MKTSFNELNTTRYMHKCPGFETVLQVAHREWHGIRNATGAYPGNKLLISCDDPLSGDEIDNILTWIERHEIRKVVFQGYSRNADTLLLRINAHFLGEVECFVVTHVTTTQFEHYFEIEQQSLLLQRKRMGSIKRLGSVKPDFGQAFDSYWTGTIVNFAPNIDPALHVEKSAEVSLYAPLDVSWRKNMYTNIIAGILCDNVQWVKTSNFPNGLPDIHNVQKVVMTGYLRGMDLFEEMGRSAAILVATLAECQPMTQLEALAMGTPAITGPLGITEFEGDPLTELTTTYALDNPFLLSKDIGRLVDVAVSDSKAMSEMISGHLEMRHSLAAQRFAEFLDL